MSMLLTRLVSPTRSAVCRSPRYGSMCMRTLSTAGNGKTDQALRRSYLYVPSSSDRMLDKSLSTPSDDSVPPSPHDKDSARQRLSTHTPEHKLPHPERIAVRLNDITTPFFENDISEILKSPFVRTLVLPKIHSVRDLHHVSRAIRTSRDRTSTSFPIRIVASVESARSAWNLGEIASWTSEYGPDAGGKLGALLVYCADTSVVRTPSRLELLYVRSQIAIAAKAFGLDSIDMVCVNYKDLNYLKDECEDGRRLGFNGKQAIHPTQVDIIHSTFVPTEKEILRAATILRQMEVAHSSQKGAFGLEMEGGGKEMIDAPMLKQAENIIRVAKAAGLEIPGVG
ncbi:Pyruvate/Phosphoenolpyruvate kinase-like domain-containing protein [Suillus subalutaceus]|uniref:Pyruvate/Phosphoenolpyruvate kinase-like domain-containing protein n=1 Tax=Suillus subalutaceus TaxID=48586 RepID=UPI001B877592|nr:Pyruvate/Phosphoenolpyruvate kinase-like domain-containing protein [Suillus subalutaceus]KAG1861800.1 Pyruvate/Phosphoenolpyruvate kinase-like domain-containing protein [Suillus subalutaceus]